MQNNSNYTKKDDFLNPRQKEAVESLNGPVLIAAGAGSGKTRTLTNRLLKLIESGVNPANIAAVTFTNKAAREMKDRVGKLPSENSPFIGTLHSFGAKILKKEASYFSRNDYFSIFDSDDSLKTIKQIIKKMNLDRKKYSASLVQNLISRAKNELMSPEEYEADAEDVFQKKVGAIFKEYEKSLEENNAFDFDDLIEKPVRLLQDDKNIRKNYGDQFQYILIDEYQDINTSQYWLLRLLAEAHKNICAVGDDNQAIYSFRQADFRNFLNFERDWPDAKVILLEENYRSSANIIKSASALISNNTLQKPKSLWTNNPDGEIITITRAANPEEEGLWLAKTIKNFQSPIGRESVAILYRTNAQSRAIEQALIEYGIPYEVFGGVRFYERKEIKDIIAALRFGLNPNDQISKERLVKTFGKKLSAVLIQELPVAAKIEKLPDFIKFFIDLTKYFNYLENNYKNYAERTENVQEFLNFADYYKDFLPPLGLQLFLEQVTLMQPHDLLDWKNRAKGREKLSAPGVKLMTIHLSKGLEFNTVFLVGCNEGILPHFRSYESFDDMEEERRLMYVAMTRARHKLFLTFSQTPSRFLSELPPELIEFNNLVNQADSFNDDEMYLDFDVEY